MSWSTERHSVENSRVPTKGLSWNKEQIVLPGTWDGESTIPVLTSGVRGPRWLEEEQSARGVVD